MDSAPVPVEQSHFLSSVITAATSSAITMSSSLASASASASASAAALVSGNGPFKIVGICLAVGSGFFIGSRCVMFSSMLNDVG